MLELFFSSDNLYPDAHLAQSDSQLLQNAINLAEEKGVGEVIIPSINPRTGKRLYEIDKAILLPSDIQVYLENCHMVLKDGICDNIFRNRNMYSESFGMGGSEQKNISLIGIGHSVLDGTGHNDVFEWIPFEERSTHIAFNNLVVFHNVDGFEIKNIEVCNQRWWAMNLIYCSNGHICDITDRTQALFPNQDGICIRYGCHHITIERISGNSGGDFISLSALGQHVSNGYLHEAEGKSRDIHDIVIRDIIGTSAHEAIVSLRCHDESRMYNIHIENIIESNYDNHNLMPYGTVLLGQKHYYSQKPGEYGSMSNITVRNIYTKSGGACITLGNTLIDSRIENLNVEGAVNAVTTINYDHRGSAEIAERAYVKNGIKLSNVTIDGVHISGSLVGVPIELGKMQDDDFIHNLEIVNITDKGNDDTINYCRNGKSQILTTMTNTEFVKKVDNYMKKHIDKDVFLDEIAHAFDIDKYKLCRIYSMQSGTTVIKSLRKMRIEKAKKMLKTGNEPISKIASACGFRDLSYFTKIFKNETAHTPESYRKLNKVTLKKESKK